MNNVIPLFDQAHLDIAQTNLVSKQLDETFKKGKYILAYYDDEMSPWFFSGNNMTIGDLVYLKKLIDVKLDNMIEANLQ